MEEKTYTTERFTEHHPAGDGRLDTSFLRDRGHDHESAEAGEKAEPERFSAKRTARIILLGLAGFLVGLIVFLPGETLWTHILNRVSTDAFAVTWERMESSGLYGATLHEADVNVRGFDLHFTTIDLHPGLSKPLSLTATTGNSKIESSISWSKRIKASGEIDNGVLLGPEMSQGIATLHTDLRFKEWTDIPEQGALVLRGLNLSLPNKLNLTNLRLDLTKIGQEVQINNIATDKPLQMQASGTLNMNESAPLRSSYQVEGTITMGKKVNRFKKSGTLAALTGLAAKAGAK